MILNIQSCGNRVKSFTIKHMELVTATKSLYHIKIDKCIQHCESAEDQVYWIT